MLDLTAAYERHAPQILRYLRIRTGDADAAADLAGAVWLEAVEHAADYEERGYPVSAWLYRIAAHRSIDYYRRRRRRVFVALDEQSLTVDAPAEPLELSWWPKLKKSHRQVLALELAGYTGPQAARAMGLKIGGHKGVLHRARRAAQKAMDSASFGT